jgi:hypothetical protein
MSESLGPLRLKHPSGFFAAGSEVRDAIGLLSDGAFKLFVYVCLHADRRTAQLRFRNAELAKAVGHSTRSLTTYLDELDRAGVGAVYRASNQHELGRVEILDRFWPYHKQSGDSTTDPEQAHYVARVRDWFLGQACVTSAFGAADEKLAGEWYRSGISLDVVGRAFLLGCARKYVALFNNQGGTPVTSLNYFSGIVTETAAMEVNLNYGRYLSARVKKMDAQWRAQANFARAETSKTAETK